MKKKYVLGIDTSNYTTSLALVTTEGEIVANIKYPLPVKDGARGLRQSDAVFAHVKNLPLAMEEVKNALGDDIPVAIGVSNRPRNVEGSYMPCFLVGEAVAESISATTGAPLYKFSHQCGHMMAALCSSGREDFLKRDFCAFHISGGTTEMLEVRLSDNGFCSKLIGGTADLNAGQVIDRVGVAMGLKFPCGREMETLALQYTGEIPKRKVAVDGLNINLSGLENIAIDFYKKSNDAALVSAFVFSYVANSIASLVENYISYGKNVPFLFAGGVMSNSIIKNKLSAICDASFAEPALSSDNAVGVAMLALRSFKTEKI